MKHSVRQSGLEALARELGVVSTVRFLQQFETGEGDYTQQRYEWLGTEDVQTLAAKIQASRQDNRGNNVKRGELRMGHPRFSSEEIYERGEKLYQRDIRDKVETSQNIGKFVSIDIETGDFEVADDPITAGDRLLAKSPNAALYGAKIGYDAAYALGGTLTRTAP